MIPVELAGLVYPYNLKMAFEMDGQMGVGVFER